MERASATRPDSVIEALGTAWTVYSLYPDPEQQPAFRRSIESLRSVTAEPVSFSMDALGFLFEGEQIDVEREGADRLAKRCYFHHVEAFGISSPPSENDVIRLFNALAKEEELSRATGGVGGALRRDGVTCFSLVQRALLATGGQENPMDRDPSVQEVIDNALDPRSFAADLIAEFGTEPGQLAEAFYRRYHEILERVNETDLAGRESVVQAFVEVFFYFEELSQVASFERFLGGDHAEDRMFLDQFAGHELAKLAPRLDSTGLGLLLDYARVATDQADTRPAELLGILKNPEALQSMREVAATKVQERLGDLNRAAESGERFLAVVKDQFPDPRRYFYDALEVFRGLLAVEDRDDRFSRLMRIWVGKVAESVRARDFRRAELWLRAATARPTYNESRTDEISEALGQIASTEVMGIVIDAATAAEGKAADDPSVRLMQALGPRAVNSLVDLLAEEEEKGRRRLLIDLLSDVARDDPEPLIARLTDDRWYVVRNLLTVLRDVHPEPGAAISQTASHPDHRVRMEALRVLSAGGEKGLPYMRAALSDSEEKVRGTAIGLLGAHRSSGSEQVLLDTLADRSFPTADKNRVINALAAFDTVASKDALTALANRKLIFSSTGRSLRASAQSALQKGNS